MSTVQQTKNDIAWEQLFEKYNIKEEIDKTGYYIISSSQINEFRQARLMTKFDNQKTLPKLFKDNNIAIYQYLEQITLLVIFNYIKTYLL